MQERRIIMTIYCGVDFHTRQQLIKWCDTTDGEIKEQRLFHDSLDDVRNFYSQFSDKVLVGIEACGYSEWFERLLQELGHEVWVGDATKIRRRARSRQKTDRRDAELLIDLLLKDEFPRISRLTFESLEVLRRLRYRHRLVQMRTRMRNSLQAIALGSGVVLKSKLRTRRGREKLNDLPLSPVLSQQRGGWLEMIEEVEKRIAQVEQELEKIATGDERVCRLRTHPGIGLLTGLALVHTLSPVDRFTNTRKVTAYVGLEPREYSSGERRRMGRISKAGSRVLRFLLVEAGIKATRVDAEMKRLYYRVLHRREQARAKVTVARHLLIHAFIMLRDEIDYAEFKLRGAEKRSNARTIHRPNVPDHLIERPASE
jgi:transposase